MGEEEDNDKDLRFQEEWYYVSKLRGHGGGTIGSELREGRHYPLSGRSCSCSTCSSQLARGGCTVRRTQRRKLRSFGVAQFLCFCSMGFVSTFPDASLWHKRHGRDEPCCQRPRRSCGLRPSAPARPPRSPGPAGSEIRAQRPRR